MDEPPPNRDGDGDGDTPSLQELAAALFEEELKLPVAGAIALLKELLRFALAVITLAACVALYCLSLIWLSLFCTNIRLVTAGDQLLRTLVPEQYINAALRRRSQTSPPSAQEVQEADVTDNSTNEESHEETTATSSHSALSAEVNPSTQRDVEVDQDSTAFTDAEEYLDSDGETSITHEILQREKRINQEIKQLSAAPQVKSGDQKVVTPAELPANVALTSENSDISAQHGFTVVSEADSDASVGEVDRSAAEDKTVEPSVSVDIQHPHESGFTSEDIGSMEVRQLGSPKWAQDQQLFQRRMNQRNNHRRVSRSYVYKDDGRIIYDDHSDNDDQDDRLTKNDRSQKVKPKLPEFWQPKSYLGGENSRPRKGRDLNPTKAKPYGPIPGPLSAHKSAPNAGEVETQSPEPKRNVTSQTGFLPPHKRSGLEASARRAAAGTLASSATTAGTLATPATAELSNTVVTRNFYATLPEVSSDQSSRSSEDNDAATDSIAPEKDNTDSSSSVKDPSSSQGLVKSPAERMYTEKELKAYNTTSPLSLSGEIAGKIEAAAKLIASHTRTANSTRSSPSKPSPKKRSPKKKSPTRAAVVAAVAAAAVVDELLESAISTLEEFSRCPREVAIKALKANNDDVQDALNALFEGGGLETVKSDLDPATGNPPAQSMQPSTQIPKAPLPKGGLTIDVPKSLTKPPTKTSAPEDDRVSPITPDTPVTAVKDDSFAGLPLYKETMAFDTSEPDSVQHSSPSSGLPVVQPMEFHPLDAPFDAEALSTYPMLVATQSLQSKMPPGLGSASSSMQARFDALLYSDDPPSRTEDNLGKFITAPSRSGTSLSTISGEAVGETPSTVLHSTSKSTHEVSDVSNSELPIVVNMPGNHIDDNVATKAAKRQARKAAREVLKEAWFVREQARIKMLHAYDLDADKALVRDTKTYLQKRSELEALGTNGVLNDEDARRFPAWGLRELTMPTDQVYSWQETADKKRDFRKAAAIKAAEPIVEEEEELDIETIIEKVVAGQDYCTLAKDPDNRERLRQGVSEEDGQRKIRQMNKRAYTQYTKNRKLLVEAHPEGLPADLEARFPEITDPDVVGGLVEISEWD